MIFRFIKNNIIKLTMHGFSIIEMMIVLVLIGIIATISISTVTGSLSKAKIKTAQIQAYELARLLDIYNLQFGKYPHEESGWNELLNPPDNIPLLRKMPIDPWQNQYVYLYPGEHNLKKPDVLSRGPDGKFSNDDVGNWEK